MHVFQVMPSSTEFIFRTEKKVPKLGVMLVGWGGNNGTTVTAAVLANKLGLTWKTKTGVQVISQFYLFILVVHTEDYTQQCSKNNNDS